MSNNNMLITDAVLNMPWAILPAKLTDILGVLYSKEHGELLTDEKLEAKVESVNNADKRYTVEDGIATIPIYGILAKRFNIIMALSGGTSYELLEKDIQAALSDNDVKGLFLDMESPGGAVDGMTDVTDIIYNARNGEKPIMAFANGLMASAAYHIGSAADYIVAANVVASDRSTEIGSLGVVAIHLDKSKKYEKEGIKPTVFSAGKYKALGNPYEELTDEDAVHLQSSLDYMYSLAVDTVSRNRNISTEELVGLGADIFIGEQAILAGMADEVLSKQQAIERLKEMI